MVSGDDYLSADEAEFNKYTSASAVEAEFNNDLPTSDPMKEFEDECMKSFAFAFVDDNDYDSDKDFVVMDNICPPKERRPRSANAFDYSFGDVFQSSWYKGFLEPNVRE